MTRFGIWLLGMFLAAVATGCAIPRRQHVVIERYASAACVAPSSERPQSVREWNAKIQSGPGREIRIVGHQRVSGIVVARDDRTGQEHVVANADDYIYPADIRATTDFSRIFVKASGLAGGLWHETWLYEYDLVNFRQVAKIRVDPLVLPPECGGGAANR